MTSETSLAKKALIGAIVGYRRHLSGRGVFRTVRCTFEATESCSAHGLRATMEATTLGESLGRIRARLGRCESASVYRSRDGGFAWGELYDAHSEPRALEEALADELPATRSAVLRALAAVRRRSGDPTGHAEARARATARGRLLVRSDRALRRASWRRLHILLFVLAMGGLAAILFGPPSWLFVIGSGALAARAALRAAARSRRVDRILAASHFELPAPFARAGACPHTNIRRVTTEPAVGLRGEGPP